MDIKKIILAFIFIITTLFSSDDIIESQPQILFTHKQLLSTQEKRQLVNSFNTAVLYMQEGKYKEAITLFKQSKKLLKVPSFLNIGIAYYKLGYEKNAYLYLKKIYDFKELKNEDKYSYFSAAYYMYKITHNKIYINEIEKVATKAKRLRYEEKSLFIDTLILLKKYKKALKYLKTLEGKHNLKQALLYMKMNDYTNAKVYLNMAYEDAKGDADKNDIVWFKTYRDLKANDLKNLQEELLKIDERKRFFESHKKLQIELFFNKRKYSPKQYHDMLTNMSFETKLDFVYYS